MKTNTILLLFFFVGLVIQAEDKQATENNKTTATLLKKQLQLPKLLKNGDAQLGKFTLHRKSMKLTFPAKLKMTQGPLEVVISTPSGRTHEALLVTDASPMQFQTMLYLMGLHNGNRSHGEDLPQGSLIDINIEWKDDKEKLHIEPIENFILDMRTDKISKQIGWVFVGSSFRGGAHQAELDGNLVVNFSLPETVVDIPDISGGDDTIYVANRLRKEPKVGTKVKVIVQLRKN
ncbi:MAG: YdjY domain-containing protein [Verrucomicrobiota bacterium]|nr:YdjY domain-containing protein [Verrucomicrobiota bacterium]